MKKYITIIGMALLASCSNPIEEEMVTPGAEEWIPVITRSGSTAEPKEYAVTTRWWEGKSRMNYDGVLRVEGETSSWVTAPPQWPTDETKEIEVFALDCGGEFEYMVDILDDYRQYPYMVHYSKATARNKPQKFTMKHLMAQLKVNILIHEEQEHAPSDAEIQIVRNGFITCGEADGDIYLDVKDRRARSVSLPAFTKVSTSTQSGYRNDDFECAPFIVVPQTLAAGTEFMTFKVEDVEYTFTPKTDMKLEPGKVHVLTLGVTYDEDHTGGSIPVVELIDVKVTPWKDGGTIEGGEAEEDEWPNGINIYTGEYQPATLNAEGAYEIANAGNLMWMSEQIGARTIGIPYTIKLVEDVTIGEDLKWIPIAHPDGTGNASVFDGNGHTLTINQNCQDASESNFGIYASFNYSVIKNLTIKGDVVINTPSAVGVVAGTAYRTTISCVTSYANITNLGNGRVGGLVGQFGGQHSGDKYSLIENCAVYANISGTIAGGIIGYGWAGWQYYDIKNSAFYGDVTGTSNQGGIIGYHANNQTATQCTFQHIYYYEKDGIAFSGGGNTNYTLGADVIAKTPAEFASATMAELLNADQENAPWEYVTGNDYPTLKK